MKLDELFEAKAAFKLYTEHPYGNGLMKTSVARGEVLPTEDGDEVTFVGISANGLKVVVKGKNGKEEIRPEAVGGKILAADQKPEGPEFEKGKATNPRKW